MAKSQIYFLNKAGVRKVLQKTQSQGYSTFKGEIQHKMT